MLRSKGIVVHEESQEFISRLKEKLIEESREVEQAETQAELAEELADVLEVVCTLAQVNEISIEEIEKFRLNKRNSKGEFDSRIYNPSIDIQEDNPAIEYYLAKANQYPQNQSFSKFLYLLPNR
ncbi:nucleoside triphosphate pyrophosphohydrolase [Candidatus Protochlamydia sp. R18]|uniref:nucleoside triphosphate pyrophosphohydrolase n=1 Tax=Candidatus Protochlamydia sp. R18 TaxID=1353977 RepID=UPI000693AE99|nr:nucleoside triphosphate pyrophosphohydrolase [Candidatus Protochlamydia sp. R18]